METQENVIFVPNNLYETVAGYSLREDQVKFVKKALREGFKISYNYSGRFMYGRKCPSVSHDAGEFGFKGARQDQLGLGVVTYLP